MTAEVGMCNGVPEGCKVESEDVEVHTIHKPVLSDENLKLNEDKIDINCGGSGSCVDDAEILPSSEQCEDELSNAPLDVGDHAPELPVEDHELEIRDIHEIRDEGHSSDCLLSDNKEVDSELVENGEIDCQFTVSADDHPGIELHDLVNKPKKKLEAPCLVNGNDGIENHFMGSEVELACLVNGDDEVEADFVRDKHELPCLVNGEERIEGDLVGGEVDSPCLDNGEESVERDLVEDKIESPSLDNGEESIERDLVGDKLESPCFINREDGAERNFVGSNELEQRSPLVAEVQEINSPEVMTGNDKYVKFSSSGRDFVGNIELEQDSQPVAEPREINSNGQNQIIDSEFQCLTDKNSEFGSESISVDQQKLELNCGLKKLESVVSEENNPEQNSESQIQNLENEDDACGHIIDEEEQSEPLFMLNANKGQNDEIEIGCLPNGDSELESRFHLNDDNELEPGCFDNEDSGVLTEDMDGQQVDEVHHEKDEISDPESSDCNVSNIGGSSDVSDKISGGYNHTVQPDMQESVAVSATDFISTDVLVGSNGLFTPVSENEQKPEADVTKKKLPCLVKIPRHLENKIRTQIRLAQLQLDEKTQSRDFIKAAKQMKRASKEQLIERLRAARQEERAFRDAIKSKRQEMEPVQLTLNRVKNATSVEEFDEKIYQMQYRIEHESMHLREEKQLLRDIKVMKLARDQLVAITGPHSDLQEAFDDIDKIQERSKLLGQELDSLKRQAFQAEKNVQAIEKEFGALNFDLRQLQDQWNGADSVRQEAYEALKALKKQEYERNIEFHQCRSDIQSARQYALSGEREALDKLCSNQVERIMEIWNKNVEFRKEYVKDNERSILKRLGTLDGRSLGPDEEPPLPTNYSDDIDPSLLSQGKPSASSIRSAPEVQPLTMAIPQQSNQIELKANGQQSSSSQVAVPAKKAAGQSKKSQPQLSRSILEIESFEVSPEPSKVKEEDLAKKEEEAAKMKERIREEEMRKAKEAEDRKKRQAERANAKALARAQKEAERKEKEKQKKANKKAAAAAAAAAVAATNTAGNDTSLSSDKVESSLSRDIKSSSVEGKEATPEIQKPAKPQRRKSVSQNAKPKIPFPAPPKKGRKGLQTWMWIILAVCFCLAIIILWFYF